jgi:hypothetical protein
MSAPRQREAADPIDALIATERKLTAISEMRERSFELGLEKGDLDVLEDRLRTRLWALTVGAARSP